MTKNSWGKFTRHLRPVTWNVQDIRAFAKQKSVSTPKCRKWMMRWLRQTPARLAYQVYGIFGQGLSNETTRSLTFSTSMQRKSHFTGVLRMRLELGTSQG